MNQFNAQKGCCAYCETSIELIRRIIEAARNDKTVFYRFRGTRGGGIRGESLEVERRDPDAGYNPANCSLACYFCNNDKSNVYTESDYQTFFGPARKRHFQHLADRLGLTKPPMVARD